jgi:hypothetical protein
VLRTRRVLLAAARGRAVASALQPAAAPIAAAAAPRNARRCSPLSATVLPSQAASISRQPDDTESRRKRSVRGVTVPAVTR